MNKSVSTIPAKAVNTLELDPLTILYTRVSSGSQTALMQRSAAQIIIQKLGLEDKFMVLDDHAISANSKKMEERPALMELLSLVKNGNVKYLLVYNRDRLARNSYEYSQIIKLLYQFNVNVIFTCSGTAPFQKSYETELLLSIFAQYEGELIRTRTQDANKQFPPQIFGFEKIKENGSTHYKVIPDSEANVIQFFESFSKVETKDEFVELLERFHNILDKPYEQLVNMLGNPFYCGHYIHKGSLVKMKHVEPIVSESIFSESFNRFSRYRQELNAAMNQFEILVPKCSLCNSAMKLAGRNIAKSGNFTCSNQHPKVSITVDELKEMTRDVIETFISTLSLKKIKSITKLDLDKLINRYTLEQERNQSQYESLTLKTCLSISPKDIETKIINSFNKTNEWKLKILETDITISRLNEASEEVTVLASLIHGYVTDYLTDYNFDQLTQILVDQVVVSKESVSFYLYFGDFVEEKEVS